MSIRRVDDYTQELISEDIDLVVYQVAEPQNNFISYESVHIDPVLEYAKLHLINKGTALDLRRVTYIAKQNRR